MGFLAQESEVVRNRFCYVLTVILAIGSVPPSAWGEAFMSDGFESYPLGSIDDRGRTWDEQETRADARVQTSVVHTGDQALSFKSNFNPGGYYYGVAWWDDTETAPHGQLIDLSWWHNYESGSNVGWMMWVEGWGEERVCEIANNEAGSSTTLDANTSTGWNENIMFVPADTWSKVNVQIDFAANPDVYRVGVADSGAWSDWYSMGSDETYFRKVYWGAASGGQGSKHFIDDIRIQSVPEPATLTLGLLGVVALGLVAFARRRNH